MRILIYSRQKSHSSTAAAIFTTKTFKNIEFEVVKKDDLYAFRDFSMTDNIGILVVGTELAEALSDITKERIQVPTIAGMGFCNSRVSHLLDSGYDDVVSDYKDTDEILARFRKIWRLSTKSTSNCTKFGPLTLYIDGRDPEIHGKKVKLTKTEFTILEALGRRGGTVISREALFELVWPNSDKQPFDKVLDVHMFNLRKKLEAAGDGTKFIHTLPLRGYYLGSK